MSTTPNVVLLPQHTAKLRSSCIDPTVADERGYYSITDPDELRQLGFAAATRPPALAIPLYTYGGHTLTIVRPDAPRMNTQGKPVKYDRPANQRNIIDVHPRMRPVLSDPHVPLWITESPLKIDALISQGEHAIGGVGCWFYRTTSPSGGKVILPDFQHIAWNRRDVRIVFDSDVASNPIVALAERRLAIYLVGLGARLRVARLPPLADGSKVGIDDYFAAGGTVQALVQMLRPFATRAARDWSSEDALSTLAQLGYTFRLNRCTETIEVCGQPITDGLRAQILTQMRDLGYKGDRVIEHAYTTEARAQVYHPVQDWMAGLCWDRHDHILDLTTYLSDTQPMMIDRDGTRRTAVELYLRRWLVGAVAKVMQGEQNMMLVIDGPQRIGKSYFARWLCSCLPDFFLEAPIRPDDKDDRVRLAGKFIWEVAELDATTRRADVSALKSFITEQTVTVRKAYGYHDVIKPAMASFIGTINNAAGFLADPTGSTRFLVVTLDRINFAYTREISVMQIWAQAVALYRAGEPWALSRDEREQQATINEPFQVDDPIAGALASHFVLDPAGWLSSSAIIETLFTKGYRVSPQAISIAARDLGLTRGKRRVGGRPVNGYHGIQEL